MRSLVTRALAHEDQDAWTELVEHFMPDVEALVGSTPARLRSEVQGAVLGKLAVTAATIHELRVRDLHGWIYTCLRNAKLSVLRSDSVLRRREVPLPDEYGGLAAAAAAAAAGDQTFDVVVDQDRGGHEGRVQDCLDALLAARTQAETDRKQLLVKSIQVIETIFLADLDGQQIDRAEACRRLGIDGDEVQRISEKLSRIRLNDANLPLHRLLRKLGPSLERLIEDHTSQEKD